MNDIAVFTFASAELRTTVVDGEPWFVAADVCRILGLGNTTMALRALDDDEKGLNPIETPGGMQQLNTVSESGLYALVVRSDKPNAKPFRKWVTSEVLPAIRKTGRYDVAPVSDSAVALPDRRALAQMVIDAEDRADAALALAAQRESELEIAAPKAESWDTLAAADGDFSVGDAAKVLSRDPQIKVGQQRLFTYLGEIGWLFRGRGDRRWRVAQSQVETGRLSEIPSSHFHPRTGELVLDPPQVRVTAKGLHELHRRLSGAKPLQITS